MHEYGHVFEQKGLTIIGDAVRRRRVTSGASQRQLAYWAGINQSTVSRLETGRLRTMRLVTLARVIGALRLPSDFLFRGAPPSPTRRLPGERAA